LEITGLAHDGRGVARHEGQVFLVRDALPGQTVRARIVRSQPRFAEAVTQELLRPAPGQLPPLCPHQGQCGGCPLQVMPYEMQLHWKRRLALDALSRIGRLDMARLEEMMALPLASPRLTGFRNKMEFSFGQDGQGRLVLGQRERGGRRVVPTPGCVLLPAGGNEILSAVALLAGQSNLPPYRDGAERKQSKGGRRTRKQGERSQGFWRFLMLRQGLLAGLPRWWAVLLTSPGTAAERAAVRRMAEQLLALCPQLATVIHEERHTADALCTGQRRLFAISAVSADEAEAARLTLPLGGRLFELDATSFFQVNTEAARLLAEQALALLPPEGDGRQLLDLYCGVGAPGLLLASGYAGLYGLEYDQRAVAAARRNAVAAGVGHCRYDAGDAAVLLGRMGRDNGFQDALVDPPRAGMANAVLESLSLLAPERILYISCNAATLARDALSLGRQYTLERLAGVDLFPHTPHLECLALWRRR
ncbi:MAG: TRAM domain-containing protein, partial [Desulfovibrionaceae bacterium]|nr:TRAM domain-containing protein [Desulfovibrionaceae bacterium]